VARQALESGKHVLVEKPLALELESARSLVKMAREKDLRLMVGHLLLFHPAVEHLRRIVRDGTLGRVLYAHSQRLNLGRFRTEESVLWSLATHDVSLVLDLLEGRPVRVIAFGGSYLTRGVEDVVFLALWFEDGRMAQIHVSWLDPHKVRQLTLVGDRKMVVFDDMSPTEKIRILDRGFEKGPGFDAYREFATVRHGDIMVPHVEMKEPLRAQCRHFVECIRTGAEPYTGGERAVRVIQVLAAAERSLRSRVPVAIDPEAE
jgi:predicted dehydrogenase